MEAKIFIACDTEDDSKGRVTLVNFYDGKEHVTFEKLPLAVDYLVEQYKGYKEVIVWTCNVGYDINNIFKGRYNLLDICYADSKVISAKIVGTKIKFYDTLNHWHLSVEKMGDRIGMPKIKELDVDNMRLMKKRCKRDTEIVYHFVESMAKRYKKIGCEFKMTIASTALAYFQNNFYGRIPMTLKRTQIDFLHKGYYGGRTEIFFNKPIEGTIFYHDVNSLYPSQMLNKFPTLHEFEDTRKFTLKDIEEFEGVAEVTIVTPNDLKIPYLPFRAKTKLIFPLGKFRGVYTYFELREAMKLGYKIVKRHRTIKFFETEQPFTRYVNTLYNARLKVKNDWLLETSFKNLLNHLYGKLAQRNEFTSLTSFVNAKKPSEGILEILGDMAIVKKKGEYPTHASCIWAQYVTAYGRHKLYQGLIEVENQNGLLLYCDTDSVIYENNKQILENSKNLGDYKLENIYKYAWFKQPKLYKLIEYDSDKVLYKTRGVPWKSSKEFFETGYTRFQRPFKLREVLRRNKSPKRKVKLETNVWDWHDKKTGSDYTKRTVNKDGSTRPLRIGV